MIRRTIPTPNESVWAYDPVPEGIVMDTKVRRSDGMEDWHAHCGGATGEHGELTIIADEDATVEAQYEPGEWVSFEVEA